MNHRRVDVLCRKRTTFSNLTKAYLTSRRPTVIGRPSNPLSNDNKNKKKAIKKGKERTQPEGKGAWMFGRSTYFQTQALAPGTRLGKKSFPRSVALPNATHRLLFFSFFLFQTFPPCVNVAVYISLCALPSGTRKLGLLLLIPLVVYSPIARPRANLVYCGRSGAQCDGTDR